ncbi:MULTISPECIES: CDP-alcohol phosphatidyltransferase family protein [Salinicola]|jgi:phosphatidylglycerophosphate synthase|uniref:CDP-alcohol phosphatidyltransferase family protein n=2 Tax=Salinicola TaxID=404432 RepID=UPI000A9B1943|nr:MULTISPECIES: CDP-alcohol phosphatidyltransferase family protein [Salinicola]
MMTIRVYFEEDSPVQLWGLTPRQRLVKSLAPLSNVILADDATSPGSGSDQPGTDILVLRADYIYDQRVLNGLLDSQTGQLALTDPSDDSVVAVRACADQWPPNTRPSLANGPLSALKRLAPPAVASSEQSKLRKFDTPWVARVSASARRRLENALFSAAYKGVTDLVTKWAWPLPARAVTRLCVRWGLRPNHVTSLSYVLAILAGVLFGYGEFGAGLLAGWIMTFLDTVDGKLARVTLTSSRFGNVFDHALDLVHPPLWYIAWGVGLAAGTADVTMLLWLTVIGYVGGRLCEGGFKFAAPFSMFTWRPFDSVNRLVTARRNPNLILLTLAWWAGLPYIGLVLVTLWTLLSTLVLAVRLAQGLLARAKGEPPRAWLYSDDPRAGRHPLMVRWFTFPAIRSGG